MARPLGLGSLVVLSIVGMVAWAAGSQQPSVSGVVFQQELPVSKVVLYSSGVGYFQRDGYVNGHAEIALRFKVNDVRDLLKSMVVQDLDGGHVAMVTYDSRDPLTKMLKSFAVDLTTNPGLGAILQQVRGESVEVATPGVVRGVILGVEKKRERVGDRETVQIEYLNLLTDDGLRSLPLGQIHRLSFINQRLDAELRQALHVLATSHDTRKRTVRLVFDGDGRRRVRVAYVVEMPVWKTSYRLVLSATSRPFLQGWAIVENTTDEDWQRIRLSLVSGRPISFIMDLYEPLYVERPVVVPELYTSLRPRLYDQALEVPTERRKRAFKSMEGRREGAFSPSAPPPALAAEAAPSPTRKRDALALQQGVISAAQGTELGELFEYAISTPVSLARQQSAMLPIINQAVDGSKVSIYNESVHAKYPMSGFRLRNSTALYLMQGPITVFEGGSYAGDARLADLAPNQDQLLSYGVDLKVEVEPVSLAEQQELVSVSLRKGTLLATRKVVAEKTYTVRNRDQEQKVVLIEHPFRPGWRLTVPDQFLERTREVYRFALVVEAGKTAQLRVREEKLRRQTVRLVDAGPDLIDHYVQAERISPEVEQALRQVVVLRSRLDQTKGHLHRLEQRLQAITQEQSRMRKNMAQLARNSALYNRYVRKLDRQETEIETLSQEIERLRIAADQQKRELQDYLLGLDIQ
jgi:hypothetical protein